MSNPCVGQWLGYEGREKPRAVIDLIEAGRLAAARRKSDARLGGDHRVIGQTFWPRGQQKRTVGTVPRTARTGRAAILAGLLQGTQRPADIWAAFIRVGVCH
jgi:hypothetical protein